MKNPPLIAGLLFAVLLSGCATPVAKMAVTPSGKPEATIQTSDVGRIKAAIIGDMVNHGYTVETDTEYSLTLARKLNPQEEMLAGMFLGNSYSTNSRTATYTFVKDAGRVRVLVATMVRSQMPGGQMKTHPLDDNGNVFNTFHQQLAEIKTRIEVPPSETPQDTRAAALP